MTPRFDTRMYTNMVLTAIALLMLGGVARDFGVGVIGSAQAQIGRTGVNVERRNVTDLERTDTGVIIDSTIPQTQDVAVAAATTEVAMSNRDIAAAIRELALAVREGSGDIRSGMERSASRPVAPAGTTTAAPTAPTVPTERPIVEVAP